jgi:hypothetical protein
VDTDIGRSTIFHSLHTSLATRRTKKRTCATSASVVPAPETTCAQREKVLKPEYGKSANINARIGIPVCTPLEKWIGKAPVQVRCQRSFFKCENSPRVTWARSTCDRICARHGRLFPVADRARLRRIGHCLHSAPLSGETLRRSEAGADRRAQRSDRPAARLSRPVCGVCGREKARMRAGLRPQSAVRVVPGRRAW